MSMEPKVLVGIVYTDFKRYCRPLFPGIYNRLTYKNKKPYFVTPEKVPGLDKQNTGEQVAAMGRNAIIHKARELDVDYVFFLDLDAICDVDAIQKLISAKSPLVGGIHAGRGLPYSIIGHVYDPIGSLIRKPIEVGESRGVIEIGGASGGYLLVAKEVFSKVDYSDYKGPATIPGRHTADDEYLQIRIRSVLGIKPKLALNCQSWHLSDNGLAYQWPGKVKPFAKFDKSISFLGETFNEDDVYV